MRHSEILYKRYLKSCHDRKLEALDRGRFLLAFGKQKAVILFQLKLGRKDPYIVSELDKETYMFSQVKGEEVVINIWSKAEYEALMGETVKRRSTI